MQDLMQDPVQLLVWHVVLIKHWFNNHKRKQNDSSSVNQQSRQKRKAKGKSVIEKETQSSDSTYVDRSFTGSIHFKRTRLRLWMSGLLCVFDEVSFNITFVMD